MSTVDDLKRILNKLSSEYGVDISAIVSRSGVPIAWNIPEDVHVETFATLSATLLGASEVVYTGLNRGAPRRVIVQSDDGTLVAVGLSKKALLVAMGSKDDDKVFEGVDDAAKRIREVLRSEADI
ncbi:MAG: roadblock/LC7 domain-containing protein [Thermoplasmata archaeon]